MATCKDCIHFDVCRKNETLTEFSGDNEAYCEAFKDKANYEEVKRGRWIPASNKPGVNIGLKCSRCGARIKNSEFLNGNHNYCHKCGAIMVLEGKK